MVDGLGKMSYQALVETVALFLCAGGFRNSVVDEGYVQLLKGRRLGKLQAILQSFNLKEMDVGGRFV